VEIEGGQRVPPKRRSIVAVLQKNSFWRKGKLLSKSLKTEDRRPKYLERKRQRNIKIYFQIKE